MLPNIKFILFFLKKLMANRRCRTLSTEHATPLDEEKYAIAVLFYFSPCFFSQLMTRLSSVGLFFSPLFLFLTLKNEL